MILRRIFDNQATGFYVDVGAHHPRRFSNTFYFYKKGWSGINIDAMPGSMDAFRRSRPRDINIEVPISEANQVLTYYAFDEPAVNGFSKELSKSRVVSESRKIIFTKDIKTCRLEDVLDEKLPQGQVIDFLSIDVEGLDYDVLQSTNLKKYKPRVVLVEILGSTLDNITEDKVYQYLRSAGYELYSKAVNTVIFRSIDFNLDVKAL